MVLSVVGQTGLAPVMSGVLLVKLLAQSSPGNHIIEEKPPEPPFFRKLCLV